jgi:hypothetical protein
LVFLLFGSFEFFAPFKGLNFGGTGEFPSSFFLFSIFQKLYNQDFLQIGDLNFIKGHLCFAFWDVFYFQEGQQGLLRQLADVAKGFVALNDEEP